MLIAREIQVVSRQGIQVGALPSASCMHSPKCLLFFPFKTAFVGFIRLRLLLEAEIYSVVKVGLHLLLLIGLQPTKYGNYVYIIFH